MKTYQNIENLFEYFTENQVTLMCERIFSNMEILKRI